MIGSKSFFYIKMCKTYTSKFNTIDKEEKNHYPKKRKGSDFLMGKYYTAQERYEYKKKTYTNGNSNTKRINSS